MTRRRIGYDRAGKLRQQLGQPGEGLRGRDEAVIVAGAPRQVGGQTVVAVTGQMAAEAADAIASMSAGAPASRTRAMVSRHAAVNPGAA